MAAEKKQPQTCGDCKKEIPVYPNMNGAGYKSYTSERRVAANNAIEVVERELCRDCALKDFEKAFPGKPLPVLGQ